MKIATLLKSSTALSIVALLALSACGGGGGDGPVTMPEPEPDPANVANAIDKTANWSNMDDSGAYIGSWFNVMSFAGDYSTVSLSDRDGAPTHLIVSNDDNGDLQLNVATFEFSQAGSDDPTAPVTVNYRRYANTYEGTRDYTDRVSLHRTERTVYDSDAGEEVEWRVTLLTNEYTNGGTWNVVIATDLEQGATAIDPFEIEEASAHDIVLDDLHDIIPPGFDFVTAYLRSTDNPLRGTLDGQPGEFSCSVSICPLSDNLEEGNYATSSPGLVFTPDDGTSPIDVTPGTWGYAPAADYLAFGYWFYVPEDVADTDAYDFGVFGSVGDLFDAANLTGLEGTATYNGDAAGMYYVGALSNSPSTGYFTAEVTLWADFGTTGESGFVDGSVESFDFEDDAHSSSFPESIYLGYTSEGNDDNYGVPRGTTNIYVKDHSCCTGFPGGFTAGWVYADFENNEWYGTWNGQFHGNGRATTDHPAGIAGSFATFLPTFDSNGDMVAGQADRGLAGGYAARKQDDTQ